MLFPQTGASSDRSVTPGKRMLPTEGFKLNLMDLVCIITADCKLQSAFENLEVFRGGGWKEDILLHFCAGCT